MNKAKSLKEIDLELPNGFHDAFLEKLTLNYLSNSAELDLELWVGDPDTKTEEEREATRKARLYLNDLLYFVIEPPYPGYKYTKDRGVGLDAGDAMEDSNPKAPKPQGDLPDGAFAYWFFAGDWNAFIHVAALSARLDWV